MFHALRGLMGDERFFSFLKSLRDRFAYRAITTDGLRREAAQWMPAQHQDTELEEFFDAWVYSAGDPAARYQLEP